MRPQGLAVLTFQEIEINVVLFLQILIFRPLLNTDYSITEKISFY